MRDPDALALEGALGAQGALGAEGAARATLAERLVRRTTGVTALALLALNGVSAWMFHTQLHHQTDAVLLALAATEGAAHAAEVEGGAPLSPRLRAPLHVHPAVVPFPWGGGREVSKYALALDERCAVQASTRGFAPAALPADLCGAGAPARAFFAHAADGRELRAASFRSPRGQTFVVGIEHAPLDVSLWRVVSLLLSSSAAVLWAVWRITRAAAAALTADLRRLDAACAALTEQALSSPVALERLTAGALGVGEGAPRELHTLSRAMSALVGRLLWTLRAQRRFLAEAAHELRTPLTALRGELEVTLRRERTSEEYREALRYLEGDVGRLARLSERLLEAAASQEGALALAPTDLRPLVERAARVGLAGEVPVDLSALPPSLWALADADAAERALLNIFVNARLHAGASRVWARGGLEGGEVGEGLLTLWVEDDGVGFPPQLAQQLFTPFVRGGEGRSGYGLGLSITRGLMERQGGGVEAALRGEGEGAGGARVRLWWRAAPAR